MAVFVLDRNHEPMMPCTEKRARLLLARKRAVVHRVRPFVIRLVDRLRSDSDLQPLSLKIDPGSRHTGLALVRVGDEVHHVLGLFELNHRGVHIRDRLVARRLLRVRRRRRLRFRPQRSNNPYPKGWIAPSLMHRVDTVMSWAKRVIKWAPLAAVAMELVRFDARAMEQPGVKGIEYQRGSLMGVEIKEYVLAKWGRRCAYCDKTNVPLEVEHVVCRARGGSNRASNLTLACVPCNRAKGTHDVRVFVKDPARIKRILAQLRRPMRDAEAVNTTRWRLLTELKSLGLEVSVGSGGLTKWNRTRFKLPKTHALDAVCVGKTSGVQGWEKPTLVMDCTGRGTYQRTHVDKHGFPRCYLMRTKRVRGFATGDLVRAVVPTGRKQGSHLGRALVRANGSFSVKTRDGMVPDLHHKHFKLLQRADGYSYQVKPHTSAKFTAVR